MRRALVGLALFSFSVCEAGFGLDKCKDMACFQNLNNAVNARWKGDTRTIKYLGEHDTAAQCESACLSYTNKKGGVCKSFAWHDSDISFCTVKRKCWTKQCYAITDDAWEPKEMAGVHSGRIGMAASSVVNKMVHTMYNVATSVSSSSSDSRGAEKKPTPPSKTSKVKGSAKGGADAMVMTEGHVQIGLIGSVVILLGSLLFVVKDGKPDAAIDAVPETTTANAKARGCVDVPAQKDNDLPSGYHCEDIKEEIGHLDKQTVETDSPDSDSTADTCVVVREKQPRAEPERDFVALNQAVAMIQTGTRATEGVLLSRKALKRLSRENSREDLRLKTLSRDNSRENLALPKTLSKENSQENLTMLRKLSREKTRDEFEGRKLAEEAAAEAAHNADDEKAQTEGEEEVAKEEEEVKKEEVKEEEEEKIKEEESKEKEAAAIGVKREEEKEEEKEEEEAEEEKEVGEGNGRWALFDSELRLDMRHDARERIEAVIEAMELHAGLEDVQRGGCAALWNLSLEDDESKALIGAAGAIELVLAAMRQHASSEGLQAQGCGALSSLSVNQDNDHKIRMSGGVTAMVRAMRRHRGSADVQQQGCSALGNLAFNDKNQVKIAAAGGVEAVVGGMLQHHAHEKVQVGACGALWNLSPNKDNKVRIGAAGGIQAVLEAMKQHPESEPVQRGGCGVLMRLAQAEENKAKIAGAGGVDVIAAAMRLHTGSKALQEGGRVALRLLQS